MGKIYRIINHNMGTIASLNQEMYPELTRIGRQTAVMKHLYAIMLHMQSYTSPVWDKRYFLFSERHLAKWSLMHGISGDLKTWQSHKVFLLHAGLIKTYVVIGEQEDPILQRIWETAMTNGHRSETLWTVPFYTPRVLNKAECMAKKYRENHVNLSHIRKNVIRRVWGRRTAESLYRSTTHGISNDEYFVEYCMTEAIKTQITQKGYTTVDEIYASGLKMCLDKCTGPEGQEKMTEYKRIMDELFDQKRLFFGRHGYEYHPIRKKDSSLAIPDDHKGFIITEKT